MARLAKHFMMALVMLAVTLIALWFLLNLATKVPVIGPAADTVGQLATGEAYSF